MTNMLTVTAAKPPAPVPHGHNNKQKKTSLKPTDLCGLKPVNGNKLRRHSSHSRLITDSNKELERRGKSRNNLERSNSLTQLQAQLKVSEPRLKRSLSASNLLALSDPNLSVREAKPQRSYDSPATKFAKDKAEFTAYCQMYFHQLTDGCGNNECKNKFCNSSPATLNLSKHIAAVFSYDLASNRDKFICKPNTAKAKIFPKNISQVVNNESLPFLCGLLSTTPFRSLFLPCPMAPLNLGPDMKNANRSKSYDNIKNPSLLHIGQDEINNYGGSIAAHLSRLAGKLTSSLSSLLNQPQPKTVIDNQRTEISIRINDNLPIKSYPDVKQLFGPATFVPKDCTNKDELDAFENALAAEISQETTLMGDEFSLTHLTLEMTHNILEDYRECNDPSFIVNTLRTVFSSSESLNSSFLDHGKVDSPLCDCQILRSDIKEFYQLLQKTSDSIKFMSIIVSSIEILLSELMQSIDKVTPTEINQFIIFLDLPFLFEYGIAYKICDVIHRVSNNVKQAVIFQLSSYTESDMMQLVKGFELMLGSWIQHKQVMEYHILPVCAMLQILYNANSLKKLVIIPCHEFYNVNLSSRLDVKREYDQWQALLHPMKGRSGLRRVSSWSHLELTKSFLDFPFLLKPETKVQIMHIDAINQMREEYQTAIVHQASVQQAQKALNDIDDPSLISKEIWAAMCPYLVLEVTREHLIEDALNQLSQKVDDLKKPLKIKYIGGGEQGLDMGGLQKEFFQLAVEEIFDSVYGMFIISEETRNAWFNASTFETDSMFELVGIILGLAIYNGVILDIHLPLVIYKKLLGETPTIYDLHDIQPTIMKSLFDLLNYEGNVETDFCQTFEVSETQLDTTITIDLLPHGKNIVVTNKNRQLFTDLYVDYLLNKRIASQFHSFSKGFNKVCNGDAIKLFRPDELELLICGSPAFDFSELQTVATYQDGYSKQHPLIVELWKIFHSLDQRQKQLLLSFVTGSDRVPLKGMSTISFIIQRNGPDTDNLPTAMTCFNRLLLPEYNGGNKLKLKLLLAIENGKGFGLT